MSDAGRSHSNSDVIDDLLAYHGAGGGYEAVLANAALGRLEGLFPPEELLQLGRSLLRHPAPVARRAVDLAARLAHIAIGTDTQPGTLERRFADRAWADNPALRRLALSYLASSQALAGLLDDAELDRRARDRLQVTVENVLAAAAPTNNPLTNPAAWKEAIDTGGRSVVDGLRQLTADLQSPARLPAGVDKTAFRVGDNIAATPGKVVRKTRLYELIQYQPTAGQVDVTPSLMIASPVNKFYLLDLEPEQSVVRAQVAAGRNLFVASWVNPDQSHADVGVDEYVGAVVEMLETVAQISGTPSSHLLGLCGDCYRTINMVGGATTFVLAKGGHAIVIARPPGAPRASYRTDDIHGADPEQWLAASVDNKGSWWEHWNGWIEKHAPGKRSAPRHLGSDAHPVIGDAPGEYVRRRLT